MRFNVRPVAAGLGALMTLTVVELATDPRALTAAPARLLGFCAALVGIGAFTSILVHAESLYRRASVLDPLTGLLNRNASGVVFRS